MHSSTWKKLDKEHHYSSPPPPPSKNSCLPYLPLSLSSPCVQTEALAIDARCNQGHSLKFLGLAGLGSTVLDDKGLVWPMWTHRDGMILLEYWPLSV
jgi:hypothetical protein